MERSHRYQSVMLAAHLNLSLVIQLYETLLQFTHKTDKVDVENAVDEPGVGFLVLVGKENRLEDWIG